MSWKNYQFNIQEKSPSLKNTITFQNTDIIWQSPNNMVVHGMITLSIYNVDRIIYNMKAPS